MAEGALTRRACLVVKGVGLVTPLGFSSWQTFRALLDGRTIGQRLAELPESIDPVALARAVGCVANVQHTGTDPCVSLAEAAARQALTAANVLSEAWSEIPCYLGVSKGAMQSLLRAAVDLYARHLSASERARLEGSPVSSSRFPPAWTGACCSSGAAVPLFLGPVGYLAAELRCRLNLGPVFPVVAACASGLTALHLARLAMLRSGGSESFRRVLVVSADAALQPLLIHSYRRLGVLAPLTIHDYRSRPLDRRRCGFVLAEQAAAVLLEHVNPAAEPDPEQILLEDTAVATDSVNLVRSPTGMPVLQKMAEKVFSDWSIDVLHPHASGTLDNDENEMLAYARAYESVRAEHRGPVPRVYACKGAVGHGLGAAGLVALVLACLCARTGQIPPMPWLDDPLDSPFAIAPAGWRGQKLCTHAVFSAGFGGHMAGAVIRLVGSRG